MGNLLTDACDHARYTLYLFLPLVDFLRNWTPQKFPYGVLIYIYTAVGSEQHFELTRGVHVTFTKLHYVLTHTCKNVKAS